MTSVNDVCDEPGSWHSSCCCGGGGHAMKYFLYVILILKREMSWIVWGICLGTLICMVWIIFPNSGRVWLMGRPTGRRLRFMCLSLTSSLSTLLLPSGSLLYTPTFSESTSLLPASWGCCFSWGSELLIFLNAAHTFAKILFIKFIFIRKDSREASKGMGRGAVRNS